MIMRSKRRVQGIRADSIGLEMITSQKIRKDMYTDLKRNWNGLSIRHLQYLFWLDLKYFLIVSMSMELIL